LKEVTDAGSALETDTADISTHRFSPSISPAVANHKYPNIANLANIPT